MTSADDSTRNKPTTKPDPQAAVPEPDTEDDQHRKFREALDRKKRASSGAAGAAADGGQSGIHRGEGPKTQRMFRRKSGG